MQITTATDRWSILLARVVAASAFERERLRRLRSAMTVTRPSPRQGSLLTAAGACPCPFECGRHPACSSRRRLIGGLFGEAELLQMRGLFVDGPRLSGDFCLQCVILPGAL